MSAEAPRPIISVVPDPPIEPEDEVPAGEVRGRAVADGPEAAEGIRRALSETYDEIADLARQLADPAPPSAPTAPVPVVSADDVGGVTAVVGEALIATDYDLLVSAVLEVARFDGFDGLGIEDPESILERNAAVRHVYRRELARRRQLGAAHPLEGGWADASGILIAPEVGLAVPQGGAMASLRDRATALEREIDALERELAAAREELDWRRRQAEQDAEERAELRWLVAQAQSLVPGGALPGPPPGGALPAPGQPSGAGATGAEMRARIDPYAATRLRARGWWRRGPDQGQG